MMKYFLMAGVGALALSVSAAQNPPRQADRPNVLFIAVDDLNDFPGYTGWNPDAITPHMDRLARDGTTFSRAYCQFPTCGPSRSSIMTGLLPTTIGGRGRMKDNALQERANELGSKLLHEYFAEQGYATYAVGKVCHYHVPDGSVDESGGRGPFDAGLGRLGKNYYHLKTNSDWGPVEQADSKFPDYQAADFAIEQLQKKQDKPFMLMVGFITPHVPWYVNQKWFDLYDPDKLTLPPYKKDDLDDVPAQAVEYSTLPMMPTAEWAIKNGQWRNIVHAYLASVSFTDHQLGRILEALDASPYKDNTIIVLWSDHGHHFGEKNLIQKHSLWERSAHSPLLFAGGEIRAGKCDRVVSLMDIYPTLVELCGLPENLKNEGHSLVPLLKNPTREWSYPAITSWQHGSTALQFERYRYTRYPDGTEELYDHQKDPHEWTNLADNPEFKSVKAKFAEQLDALGLKNTIKGW